MLCDVPPFLAMCPISFFRQCTCTTLFCRHVNPHAHARMLSIYMHTCAFSAIHSHMWMHESLSSDVPAHTCMLTRICAHERAHTRFSCICTHVYLHVITYTYLHAHAHMFMRTCTCSAGCTHMCIHTNAYVYGHMCMDTQCCHPQMADTYSAVPSSNRGHISR